MPGLPSSDLREVDPSTRTAWSLLLSGGGPAFVAAGIAWFAVDGSVDNYDAGAVVIFGLGACFVAPIGVLLARGKMRLFAGALAALSIGLLVLTYVSAT